MVTFSDGSTIAYTYGADGTKLKTVHKTGSTTTTTDYCGNVVYENGVQKLLLTDEGYVTLSDGKYHYYLQDHQGNNRVVINQKRHCGGDEPLLSLRWSVRQYQQRSALQVQRQGA